MADFDDETQARTRRQRQKCGLAERHMSASYEEHKQAVCKEDETENINEDVRYVPFIPIRISPKPY
ncbi:MAG: hypothetical protein GY845_17260 [Planctomycetes bacterium]|nr:hypothetical protein [Planctomycetota bacterium]